MGRPKGSKNSKESDKMFFKKKENVKTYIGGEEQKLEMPPPPPPPEKKDVSIEDRTIDLNLNEEVEELKIIQETAQQKIKIHSLPTVLILRINKYGEVELDKFK